MARERHKAPEDQRFPTRTRLPEDLINPDGVYSGMARRNAFEDGAFFPDAPMGRAIKPKRDRNATADD